MKIKQDKEKLDVERTSTNAKAEIKKDHDVQQMDGSINRRQVADNQVRESSLKWSTDGKSLTETISYNDAQGKQLRSTRKLWTLENSEKTLHIVADLVDDDTYHLEEYFDKQ